MPRKESLDTKTFDAEVLKCFEVIQDGRTRTTQDERREWAVRWCSGEREEYAAFAQQRGLMPPAFMVACLVDVEHPLVTSQTGKLIQRSLLGAAVRILVAELNNEIVHIPSDVVHSGCVQVPVVHIENAQIEG